MGVTFCAIPVFCGEDEIAGKTQFSFPRAAADASTHDSRAAIAVAADGLQLLLGAFGWLGLDQAIDCAAMVLISKIIGFHILLLPTFVLELVPVLEDLPTWTACTGAVIVLRQREQKPPAPPAPPTAPPDKPVIDI